jgi:hypothetical protein
VRAAESCIKVSWYYLLIALVLSSAAVKSAAGDRIIIKCSPSYNADAQFAHPLRIHITIIKPIDHKMPSSIVGQDMMHHVIKFLLDQCCSLVTTERRNIGGHGMILIS